MFTSHIMLCIGQPHMFGFVHWLNPLFNAYVHLLSLLPYKWLYKSVTDDIPERNSPYFTIFHWETHHFPPIKNHPAIPPVPLRRGQLFTGLFLFWARAVWSAPCETCASRQRSHGTCTASGVDRELSQEMPSNRCVYTVIYVYVYIYT